MIQLRSLILHICLASMIWNLPAQAGATPAIEINRPDAASDQLEVHLEKVVNQSSSLYSKYLIHFENRADHEVTYTDLKIKFPDLNNQILTASEAEARGYERDESLAAAPAGSSSYSSSGSSYPIRYYHVPSSGSGNCKAACVVVIVIMVVLLIGVIAIAVSESQKGKNEKLNKSKTFPDLDQKPLQLLRYKNETRQVIIQNNTGRALGTIEIEMKDNYGRTRTFRTQDVIPTT